ncbi:hypothetical protein [Levilactobacillus brevis]|uniref:hypothetical protein n=1 Tax=Levilactobacillus brevis TaxID=1580 RepID=UPI0031DDA46E
MDIDSKKDKSVFQFSNPSTKEAVFVINPRYKGQLLKVESQQFMIKTKVEEPKYLDESETDTRTSNIFVTVTNNETETLDDETPFLLRVTMGAKFKWSKSDIPLEKEGSFLSINGASLLMSYIRPFVTTLTEQAEIQTQYIPFINFVNKNH